MGHLLAIITEGSLFVAAGLVVIRFLNSRSWGKWRYSSSLEGKVIVITGANSGIGKSVTAQLAEKGARVIMACRDEAKALAAIEDIRKKVPNGQLVYKHLDLENLNSVKQCAHEILSEDKVDVLICNAGIFESPYKITVDGYESHFQVNHLAHAMLQALLLPKMISNAPDAARVVSVTSSLAVKGVISEGDFIKNSLIEKAYIRDKAYSKTKLYALLFSGELAKRLPDRSVKILSASPGMVLTQLARHRSIPWFKYLLFAPFAVMILRTPFQGAQSVLETAFPSSEETRSLPTGSVLRNCKLDDKLTHIVDKFDSKFVYDKTLDILAADNEVAAALKQLHLKS